MPLAPRATKPAPSTLGSKRRADGEAGLAPATAWGRDGPPGRAPVVTTATATTANANSAGARG
ncbi:MAG: hypothetical protein M3Z50_14025, partial [Actinomycetota bacterium]|nr:hypothetical protein [Actinomycetota bacterium]